MLSIKEINLLQAQNEGLKKQNEDLQRENAELKTENELLKEEILKWQTAYSRQYQINENKGYNKKEEQYQQTLQDIKSIVSNIIDGYIRPYGDYEQLKKILDLITKAGSEVE